MERKLAVAINLWEDEFGTCSLNPRREQQLILPLTAKQANIIGRRVREQSECSDIDKTHLHISLNLVPFEGATEGSIAGGGSVLSTFIAQSKIKLFSCSDTKAKPKGWGLGKRPS